VIVVYWTRAAKRGREPGSIGKMATGAFVVGASYLLLAAVAANSGGERASWLWLALFFLVYTIGELFILPVGLGLFGKLAPLEFAATAIAAWFMAAFFGNLMAGAVGALWSDLSPAVFFALTGAISAASGALFLVIVGWANRVESRAVVHASGPDPSVGGVLAAESRH
jgi:POT family proton-dependent oligopeptide transporter